MVLQIDVLQGAAASGQFLLELEKLTLNFGDLVEMGTVCVPPIDVNIMQVLRVDIIILK